MNRFLLIFAVFLFIGCKNEKTRSVNFPGLGWTLHLPLDMHFKDSAFDQQGNIRDSLWEKINVWGKYMPRVELFSIRISQGNHFNAVVYIDTSDLSTWKKNTIKEARDYFDLFKGVPDIRIIDTSISTETLDHIDFIKQSIVYRPKKKDKSYTYQFSRKYRNYGIYINLIYTDPKIGDRYLRMIKRSDFSN